MGFEVVYGELKDSLQLLELEFAAADLRCVKRSFVVIMQQMFKVRCRAGCYGPQQMLRQNDSGAKTSAVGTVFTFSNAIEPVAGSDYPRIRRWALEILT